MPIWIGTNGVDNLNSAGMSVGTSKVQNIYVGTSRAWFRRDPIPHVQELFIINPSGTFIQQYNQCVSSFSVGTNPLSTYDHLRVRWLGSYYDPSAPPGYEEVWTQEQIIIDRYGNTDSGVPLDLRISLDTLGNLKIDYTGNGPMGGWLHYPKMSDIRGWWYD